MERPRNTRSCYYCGVMEGYEGSTPPKVMDVDIAFGSVTWLPPWDDIPPEFKHGRNVFTDWAWFLFYGGKPPNVTVEAVPGIDVEEHKRQVRATLASYAPKHEHKMAGVAYMLSKAWTVHAPEPEGVA